MNIVISKANTIFKVGFTNNTVMLRDDNCIWLTNDEVHFTKTGWANYLAKQDYLSESIDKMRDL